MTPPPRRTPLYEAHRALGARFVEFAGWEMPLKYSGVFEEHYAVRRACGLFDVSHMGEIELRGPGAAALCQRLTVNDVRRLQLGDGQYTLFCNERGGVLDDLIVYRLEEERFLLIVNAANTAADHDWIQAYAGADVEVLDRSAALGLLALQGPEAEFVLRTLTPADLPAMRPFTVSSAPVAGLKVLISRTGYTGEDGFELVVDADAAPQLWDALLEGTQRRGGLPAGLGARDTLRLEAGLPLCGTDMDAETTPLEAGLAWVVKLAKGDFIGRSALAGQANGGIPRRLAGIELQEPGIPRHGDAVWAGDRAVGLVTSGIRSPTLGTFIGLTLVEAAAADVGQVLGVETRGRRRPARVVARPFYRRTRQEV
jgi:aminomethyltransferase